MKIRNYVVALMALVIAFVLCGFAFASAHDTPEIITVVSEGEETLFWDNTAVSVGDEAPVAENTWMLANGIYEVVFTDGSIATLNVSDGSWFIE